MLPACEGACKRPQEVAQDRASSSLLAGHPGVRRRRGEEPAGLNGLGWEAPTLDSWSQVPFTGAKQGQGAQTGGQKQFRAWSCWGGGGCRRLGMLGD